jgi:hypothetical protein
MSTFTLEHIKINRKFIFRRFKLISQDDSNPFHTLQSFTFGTELTYKCVNKSFICNVVCHLHELAVLKEYFFIGKYNINGNRNNSLL